MRSSISRLKSLHIEGSERSWVAQESAKKTLRRGESIFLEDLGQRTPLCQLDRGLGWLGLIEPVPHRRKALKTALHDP